MGRKMGPRIRLLPESEKKIASPPSQAVVWAVLRRWTLVALAAAKALAPPVASMSATKPPTKDIMMMVCALDEPVMSTNR